ncbi:MAG: hypothetical protein H0U66_06985 [Gemmatimonadaceae bacterium]|nr:hypothetical protein [Gemmatimonadaceae bacterium]
MILRRSAIAVLTKRSRASSAPEVGAQLSISKKTVETYKKRIGDKLGFAHRSEYVRFALEVSVLAPPVRDGLTVS